MMRRYAVLALAALLLDDPARGFSPPTTARRPPSSSPIFHRPRSASRSALAAEAPGDPHSLLTGVVDRREAAIGAGAAAAGILGLAGWTTELSSAKAATTTATSSKVPEWSLGGGVRFPTLALNTVGLSAEDAERAMGLAR